jgi:soluble lytic murein transglycosylase
MAPKLARELAVRDAQVPQLIAKKQLDLARRVQTDRILLSSANNAAELKRLADIYRQIPAYRTILELKPQSFPHFPLPPNADRASLLMAMGLFDEAADDVMKRWALRPPNIALTRSLALNMGNASKDSIYAVEVLMKSVPDDYVPELLPMTVRQLLYPRYFFNYIVDDSKHFGADPTLVLSIMREESRFNPRAKSEAAARGLLQFIITTARDIGRDIGLVNVDPDDLYDPRVIIRLGAKYVSTLSQQFANDRYATAAAYNAGPNQVKLWKRLAPGDGDDFFLSSINFDETKNYVRKVMNSYKRYEEIYGNAGPQGGIRMEP